jgi:EAL domain-containing protein (putative c-di-GMP-specific phosphodiesterase class I)
MTTPPRLHWTDEELGRVQDSAKSGPRSTRLITTADLDVVFQPIVDLKTGATFALEALVRCKWPEYKNPAALFERAVAERATGRLGRPIRDVTFARGVGHRLFINVHPDELSSRWLVRPDDPLNYHEGDVYLEITESAAFEYFDLCRGVLAEICSRSRVHLVVDDFGAGHSNLKRVIDLQPSVVKLDRQLISALDRNPRQQVLVKSVIEICKDLGATVVAEGIETREELERVRDAGADFAQGYLLARPGYPVPAVAWPP